MRIAWHPSLVRPPSPGVSTAKWASFSSVQVLAGRCAVAVLTAFHAWLFWVHATTGRLLDPATAFRWFAGALILCGFVAMRRLGGPLLWGRKALVFWLLVVLLHCSAVGAELNGPAAGMIPESVSVLVVQIATAAPGVLLGLGLLSLLARRHGARPRALPLAAVRGFACGTPLAGHVFRFSPRPPPDRLPA